MEYGLRVYTSCIRWHLMKISTGLPNKSKNCFFFFTIQIPNPISECEMIARNRCHLICKIKFDQNVVLKFIPNDEKRKVLSVWWIRLIEEKKCKLNEAKTRSSPWIRNFQNYFPTECISFLWQFCSAWFLKWNNRNFVHKFMSILWPCFHIKYNKNKIYRNFEVEIFSRWRKCGVEKKEVQASGDK